MRSVLRVLDDHWFAPASLRELAVFRISAVLAMLLFMPTFHDTVGHAALADSRFLALPALKVLMLPFGWGAQPTEALLFIVLFAAVLSGVCSIVGVKTRLSLWVFAATTTFLVAHRYSYGSVHHGPGPVVIALWILAMAPSGRALSFDSLRARLGTAAREPRFQPRRSSDLRSPMARWPVRLMQWTLVLIYLSAGISKLQNGGLEWFNGYTLVYFFAQDGVRHGGLGLALAQSPELATILSVASVAFEITFAAAILLPAVAWLYLLAGASFHTSIFVLQRAPFIRWIFLYAAFLEPLRRRGPVGVLLRRAGERFSGEWTVHFDGGCPWCRRRMALLNYFDFTDRLRYVNVRAADPAEASGPRAGPHEFRAIGPGGIRHEGSAAARELFGALPALWPVGVLLSLPGFDRLGARAWRRLSGPPHHGDSRAGTSVVPA